MAQTVKKSTCNVGDQSGFDPWVWKIPLEKGMATHSGMLGLQRVSKEKELQRK